MRLRFEEAGLWSAQKRSVIQRINQSGMPLALFGRAYPVNPGFLKELVVPILYICDNDPAAWGSMLWGLEIVPPAKLEAVGRPYNVLILVPFEHEIVPQLQKLSFPPEEIFRLDLYFEDEDTVSYFREMQPVLEDTWARLADQRSRDTYEAAIQYRIGRDAACLAPVIIPRAEQYFPKALGGAPFLGEQEVFVDVGAFTGDTVRDFVSAVHGKYAAIHAFEPEPDAWRQLLENTRELPNVTCWQIGVGGMEQTARFSFGGSSSKVDGTGGQTIHIDTLDHALGDTPVTYLKMDIEGMERPALMGARNLIQTRRPKLAVCAYHSNADMVMIPRLIWEINPDYRLYIRHYSYSVVETICYAV